MIKKKTTSLAPPAKKRTEVENTCHIHGAVNACIKEKKARHKHKKTERIFIFLVYSKLLRILNFCYGSQ